MTYYSNYNTYAQKWTEDAKFCYERGCTCTGCYMRELLESTECNLKRAVLILVKKFGKPPEHLSRFENITDKQQEIIDAIMNGCETFKDIAKEVNRDEQASTGLVRHLYKKARRKGWKPDKSKNRCLLEQFIKWVRQGGFE